MISEESKKILQSLKTSQYGRALEEFLNEEYSKINNVSQCVDWEDTIGRKHALATLDKLFSFILNKPKVEPKGENRKYE